MSDGDGPPWLKGLMGKVLLRADSRRSSTQVRCASPGTPRRARRLRKYVSWVSKTGFRFSAMRLAGGAAEAPTGGLQAKSFVYLPSWWSRSGPDSPGPIPGLYRSCALDAVTPRELARLPARFPRLRGGFRYRAELGPPLRLRLVRSASACEGTPARSGTAS